MGIAQSKRKKRAASIREDGKTRTIIRDNVESVSKALREGVLESCPPEPNEEDDAAFVCQLEILRKRAVERYLSIWKACLPNSVAPAPDILAVIRKAFAEYTKEESKLIRMTAKFVSKNKSIQWAKRLLPSSFYVSKI